MFASKAGMETNPDRYDNLLADPAVNVWTEPASVAARTAGPGGSGFRLARHASHCRELAQTGAADRPLTRSVPTLKRAARQWNAEGGLRDSGAPG